MTDVPTSSGNSFQVLPEEMVYSIFLRCSPVTEVRAAASCKYLQTVYRKHSKDLVSHSASIDISTVQDIPLCPNNVGKLLLTLEYNADSSGAIHTYTALHDYIDRLQQGGITKLPSVEGLAMQHRTTTEGEVKEVYDYSSMHRLMQMFPNLRTLYLADPGTVWILLGNAQKYGIQAQSSVYRAAVAVDVTGNTDLTLLPAALPNLDTLCLTMPERVDASFLQPSSKLSQLKYLSLVLVRDKVCAALTAMGLMLKDPNVTLPDMRQLQSLRHLKLQRSLVDLRSISGLSQLDSISLCNMHVAYPEALARLNVTSMTLHSVSQLGFYKVTGQHQAGPCWAKLKRLYLGGKVSEQLLQAMLLPQSTAGGLNVMLRGAAVDDFCNEYKEGLAPGQSQRIHHVAHWHATLMLKANKMPQLGPAYFAAARATSIYIYGDFAVEALQQLQDANAPVQQLYLQYNYQQNPALAAAFQP